MLDWVQVRNRFPAAARAALVTDANVDRRYGDTAVRGLEATGLGVERIVFPAGEASKNLETYAELVRGLAALELTRSDIVIAFGGGVVSDLAGFAAATYLRGLDWVAVPTTLLAMVDAAVGGKTGVDLPEGKNLLGAFWAPALTLRNPDFLVTLSEREWQNGLVEIVKMGILFDPALCERCRRLRESGLTAAIERAVALKTQVVKADFRDGGERRLLNLGHTFGHALEQASGYRLAHGEAVAMGMRIVSKGVPEIAALLDELKLGTRTLAELDLSPEAVMAALAHDKKRSGDQITIVVPRRIGQCELREMPLSELRSFL